MDILDRVNSMSIYFQLIFASFLWGSNVIVMKLLLPHIPFLFLAFLRVFLSALCLGVYLFFRHFPYSCMDKKKLFIISFLAIYLNFVFTFIGMNQVKGIDNAFMNALAPMITFLFSFFILKKHLSFHEWISMFISVLAFLLSIRFQIFSIKIGFFYLLFGMVLYISGNILIQKWHIHHNISFVFHELIYGSIFLMLHCMIAHQFVINKLFLLNIWQWLLLLIVSGIGFAYIQVIYMKAITCIGVIQTSFFLSLNPIFTYFESLIFLQESFDFTHFVSFILLIIGLIIANKKKLE